MAFSISLDCFDEFTARFIRSKVNKLVEKPGFRKSDRSDLIQTFAADLVQRSGNFDPDSGTWEAFVVVVCQNCCANILEHRRAKMRSPDREEGSLNRKITDSEGQCMELGDTLPDSAHCRRTGHRAARSHVESFNLAEDVASVLRSLPPKMRELCQQVMHSSVGEVARQRGVSRSTVYRQLGSLVETFERGSLREYL